MNKIEATKKLSEIDVQIKKLNDEKTRLLSIVDRVHPDERVNDFLTRYSGKNLLSLHSLDEYGTWEVKGEDPNCEVFGPHSSPHLGFFKGKLDDVLRHAVNIPGFWQWGAGGEISKVKEQLITEL